MKKLLMIFFIPLVAVLMVFSNAGATPMLQLISGTTDVTIEDGSVLDVAVDDDGVIVFYGVVGNFTVNTTTGVTKPYSGSSSYPDLDLNSFDASSSAGGTLTIRFWDTGFSEPDYLGLLALFGGTTAGTIQASVYADDVDDNPFEATNIIMTSTLFGPGAFSDELSGLLPTISGTYSIGIEWVINHTGKGNTSGDLEVKPVPEPATMLLLGVGLAGLGAFGRKRLVKNA